MCTEIIIIIASTSVHLNLVKKVTFIAGQYIFQFIQQSSQDEIVLL
jgi:hypothetical protein